MNKELDTVNFLKNFTGHNIFISMEEYGGTPMHYHSGYKESKITLDGRNSAVGEKRQHGIFFTVNELDEGLDPGRHRTGKMVTRFRAIFMDDDNVRDDDDDGDRSKEFPLVPSLVVNSSKGKYHYYWIIESLYANEKANTVEEWKAVQNGLVVKYGGDKNAKDTARYLRLPGFTHWKNKEDPYEVTWSGNGTKYEWKEIVAAFPPIKEGKIKKSAMDGKIYSANANATATVSTNESEKEIVTGLNFHENLISLSQQMKYEGIQDRYIVMAMQGLMNQCDNSIKSSERWISRYKDIERIVAGAREKANNDGIDIDSDDCKISAVDCLVDGVNGVRGRTGVPWPPGLFGKLADDALKMARFAYKEVAIVSALGLVAGICGRKFNVEGGGLNVYITLIMETGMGKDSINKFITSVLNSADLDLMGNGADFIGPVRFTGPKGVYKSLEKNRSLICVFTEAGLLLNSTAGDGDGLKRTLLGLYTQSGKDAWSGREVYSDEDKSIKGLRAPALSIINESTPDMLLEVFRKQDGLTTGDVPRQIILRIKEGKPKANRSAYRNAISEACMTKIRHLVSECRPFQDQDNPEAWDMVPESNVEKMMEKEEEYYIDLQNTASKDGDHNKSAMSTRAYYKAVRLAGIASVFNHEDAKIKEPEWLWAKAMIRFEMQNLNQFFGENTQNPLADIAQNIVAYTIMKILKGGYKKDKKVRPSALAIKERKQGKFKRYEVARALKNQKDIIRMNDDVKSHNPTTGINKVLSYMISEGLIEKSSSYCSPKSEVLKVTRDFFSAYGD